MEAAKEMRIDRSRGNGRAGNEEREGNSLERLKIVGKGKTGRGSGDGKCRRKRSYKKRCLFRTRK